MDNLADVVVSFVDFNEGLDFDLIIKLVVSYLVVFWVIVSLWVLKDAKDRFGNIFVALVIALMNLFLFLPFLVLYLLARPHIEDEFEDWHEGGVNVPIVNFVGQEGVEMSFELRINPKKLGQQKDKEGEMKIDINFHSDDENKQHVMPSIAPGLSASTSELKMNAEKSNPINTLIVKTRSKLSGLKRGWNLKMNEIKAKSAENAAKKIEEEKMVQEKKDTEATKSDANNKSNNSETNGNTSEDDGKSANEQNENRKKKKKKKKKRR